jgi:hypothetical protein
MSLSVVRSVLGLLAIVSIFQPTTALAWNHEASFNPADPRPDILPRNFINAWVPYRKEYNRPTYLGGRIAATIEPTSQEAMSWCEHNSNGDYQCKRPGCILHYNYPKPWEVLATEARPNAPLVPVNK